MTPHINAQPGDFAQTCLLPGDPLRAKYIATHFLEDAKEITNVRNMLGFTGYFEGKKISIMGSGMGIPSAAIYYHELITHYQVKNLIRIGTCGAIADDIKLYDMIIAQGASTDSNINKIRFNHYDFTATADFKLLKHFVDQADQTQRAYRVGNLFSTDLFYSNDPNLITALDKMHVLAVEMEAAALYGVCAEHNAAGLAICTVSDHIKRTHEAIDSAAREQNLNAMIEFSLKASITLS